MSVRWGQGGETPLTLQLFEAAFQDVGVLHLINKCCWGQAGLPLPGLPVHGHLPQLLLLLLSSVSRSVALCATKGAAILLHSRVEATTCT